ncbi:MAG: isoleucine--tRNA ligase [Desulfurococcales archaeon]|nr:isoleucine--tRNA ligase [Desulfurococcales archaeon]
MAKVSGKLDNAYDPHKVEKDIMTFWEENRVYLKAKEKVKGSRKFYFLDGPPYTSASNFHVGTAWNKVLKDTIIRYFRMNGFDVWDKPGYDTHGLPIEVKIEKKLGLTSKKDIEEKIGVEKFVGECKNFAATNMESLTEGFKDLGVWMEWDDPYVTYKNEYIESGWWMIKQSYRKGLLEKSLRVHHWCPRCETTLADYEVSEYTKLTDPSIYVKFPVKGKGNTYLLIWTTTPWTLPANAFVMAHPEIDYAEVRVGDEVLILAAKRVEHVMEEAGRKDFEVIRVFKGVELEGLEYVHPLEDLVDAQKTLARYHRVVMAPEAVSEYEGTGLVHSAPGHGDVDFEVAARINAPVISLVDDHGLMTRGAGKYAGIYFREANRLIIEDLKNKGALFYEGLVTHNYPICWRCKTPLLLRATEQWVIKVSQLRDKLIREADKIEWKPIWAKKRFINLLREVRDWIISRQRFWGIPLPIWVCSSCGHIEVIGSTKDLEQLGGTVPEDLHRPWIDRIELKCPKCGGVMKRVKDVADVWFDSGVSFYASLGYPRVRELWEKLKPVDFITEGHDQIRGWFFSLLRSGVIAFDEAPYRRVLVHGFALDEHGREMHKSLGNYVDIKEVIRQMGRDPMRFWSMQITTWEDMRFSWVGIERVKRDLAVAWNVFNFAITYMGLDEFDPVEISLDKVAESLADEDRWVLSRFYSIVDDYHKAFQNFTVFEAAKEIREFIVEDVSRWYVRLIRRRVWEEEMTESKKAAYAVLYHILKGWLVLAAPFIPFMAEKLYQELVVKSGDGRESVHLEDMIQPRPELVDREIVENMEIVRSIVEGVLSARMKIGLKLRRPVARVLLVPSNERVRKAVKSLEHVILGMTNAKRLELVDEKEIRKQEIYRVSPVYSRLGPEFKEKTRLIINYIESNMQNVGRDLLNKGVHRFTLDGEEIVLTRDHVKIDTSYPEWLSIAETPYGLASIDSRIGEEEILEGIAREIVRRIQYMRKQANLPVDAFIGVWVETGDEQLLKALERHEKYVKEETRAKVVRVGVPTPIDEKTLAKEWEIDGSKITIVITW